MKILLIGSGAREHALLYGMQKEHPDYDYYAVPGNPGMGIACVSLEEALEMDADLVVIGPETPLVEGLADRFRAKGMAVFGPGAEAAKLEGSKIFSKFFMERYGIPTAKGIEAVDYQSSLKALEEFSHLPVIKANGLAAGKGVFLPENDMEAKDILKALFLDKLLGESGSKVLLEERLQGPELSFFYFVNKTGYRYLGCARDHKRAYDDDLGPNTGGMGTFSPVPDCTEEDYEQIDEIMKKTYQGILEEVMDYRGIIFIGCMKTQEGLKVLEYNVRFGDPETQVLMARLDSDFLELALATANNQPLPEVELKDEVAVCVILASKGYPGDLLLGQSIQTEEFDEDVLLFSAGTRLEKGVLVNSGGRVFSLVALGDTFEEAREKAYRNAKRVYFNGVWYRKDIAKSAL